MLIRIFDSALIYIYAIQGVSLPATRNAKANRQCGLGAAHPLLGCLMWWLHEERTPEVTKFKKKKKIM